MKQQKLLASDKTNMQNLSARIHLIYQQKRRRNAHIEVDMLPRSTADRFPIGDDDLCSPSLPPSRTL